MNRATLIPAAGLILSVISALFSAVSAQQARQTSQIAEKVRADIAEAKLEMFKATVTQTEYTTLVARVRDLEQQHMKGQR